MDHYRHKSVTPSLRALYRSKQEGFSFLRYAGAQGIASTFPLGLWATAVPAWNYSIQCTVLKNLSFFFDKKIKWVSRTCGYAINLKLIRVILGVIPEADSHSHPQQFINIFQYLHWGQSHKSCVSFWYNFLQFGFGGPTDNGYSVFQIEADISKRYNERPVNLMGAFVWLLLPTRKIYLGRPLCGCSRWRQPHIHNQREGRPIGLQIPGARGGWLGRLPGLVPYRAFNAC